MKKKTFLTLSICLIISFFYASLTFARAGGGHSSSGGGGGHSSGGGFHTSGGGGYGGSGGGGFYYGNNNVADSFLMNLIFFVIIVIVIIYIVSQKSGQRIESESHQWPTMIPLPHIDINSFIKNHDANFSEPLFLDFIYSLYAKVHELRGAQKLDQLSGYLAENVIKSMKALAPALKDVKGVVISSQQLGALQVSENLIKVQVRFEANYTETWTNGLERSWYSQELWTFARQSGVLSKAPEAARALTCPSCGSPAAAINQGVCVACGAKMSLGAFDWFVDKIVQTREQTKPQLTSTVEEVGTEFPTLYDPQLTMHQAEFETAHPEFNWQELQEDVADLFLQIQKAWSLRQWNLARPYETNSLFQTHLYWINEYKKQHLINKLVDTKVHRVQVVKILMDRFYESVTFRIYASMCDYTESESGELICGDKSEPRNFSEYWTLIRSRNLKTKNHDEGCPSCGAELKINMAGACEFCQSIITTGEFDWVLSRIEQDEAYRNY